MRSGLIPGKNVQQPQSVRGRGGDASWAWARSGIMVFGFFVSLRFRLNRDTHAVLMDGDRALQGTGGTEPAAENRAIVEDLTGWQYDQLWGRGKAA